MILLCCFSSRPELSAWQRKSLCLALRLRHPFHCITCYLRCNNVSLHPSRLSLKKMFRKKGSQRPHPAAWAGCLDYLRQTSRSESQQEASVAARKAFQTCWSTFYAIRSHHQKLRRDIRLNINQTDISHVVRSGYNETRIPSCLCESTWESYLK